MSGAGNPRVALLIDADNVSTDVIEQAISRLHAEYGALHVRRAYGTAEAAVKHQALFKRLSIRPMVNLAAGKNSTDIALAVDALDLVMTERPDVVVIASSDSDFAPLVARLREKGCLVRGIGQKGKVGEETPLIYDDWLEFEHRKPRTRATAGGASDAGDTAAAAPAKKSRSRGARSAAASVVPPRAPSPASSRSRSPSPSPSLVPAPAPAAAPADAESSAPAAKKARRTPARTAAAKSAAPVDDTAAAAPAPARKTRKTQARKTAGAEPTATEPSSAGDEAAAKPRARKTAKTAPKAAPTAAPTAAPKATSKPAPKAAPKSAPRAPAAPPAPAVPMPDKVARALEVLPALAAGQAVNVQVAAEALRRARVFSNADSWPKFFQRHADWFELLPPDRPTQVRRKAP